MGRYLFGLFFFSICFASGSVEQIDKESELAYKIKWDVVSLNAEGQEFHKAYAKRLAENKEYLGLGDSSNLAIIGLSIHKANACLYTAFPNIIYSTYNTSEDTPSVDRGGISFMSIADMMRSDMIDGKTRVHKISDFLLHLFSFNYTQGWNLYPSIMTCSEMIRTANPLNMAKIPAKDKSTAEVLHCEQVFLYRALMGNGVFDLLVDGLMKQGGVIEFLKSQNSYITFDIMTYNDMCPKCFSTCFHMSEILSSKVNEAIIRKVNGDEFSSIFGGRKGKSFEVRIQVSSFRPYSSVRKIEKKGYHCYKTAGFVHHMQEVQGTKRVSQFFNPWIAQHIFASELSRYIEAANHRNSSDPLNADVISEFLQKLRALQRNGEIEDGVIAEVSDSILKRSNVFLRTKDLAFEILPLIIEFYKLNKQSQYVDFVKRLINNPNSDIELIVSNSKNQDALLNTAMLVQESLPWKGLYNFKSMIDLAKSIEPNNLEPTIKKLISEEIMTVITRLRQEQWKNMPKNGKILLEILEKIRK